MFTPKTNSPLGIQHTKVEPQSTLVEELRWIHPSSVLAFPGQHLRWPAPTAAHCVSAETLSEFGLFLLLSGTTTRITAGLLVRPDFEHFFHSQFRDDNHVGQAFFLALPSVILSRKNKFRSTVVKRITKSAKALMKFHHKRTEPKLPRQTYFVSTCKNACNYAAFNVSLT